MISLLIFCFVTFAIAWTIGHAHITYELRTWLATKSKFLVVGMECVGCVCFHLGWLAFVFRLAPSELTTWWQAAFFTAASGLLLGRLAGFVNED